MQMAESQRDYTKNSGIIAMPEMPDDRWCIGAIAVMWDGERYTTVFHADGQELPTPEIREELGSLITHSWEVANHPGFTEEEN